MQIISLTTIPSRFCGLRLTLECLLAQGADQVWLNIPFSYRRFPDWDGSLPSVPDGVTINRCEIDFGPATKVLPATKALRGQDVQILFCDDDCIVPNGWARRLFSIQAARPKQAVATYVRPSYLVKSQPRSREAWQVPIKYDLPYRASRLIYKLFNVPTMHRRPFWIPGYGQVLFGVGGAVVRPDFFVDTAYHIPDICWPVDDIWLSAMLALNQIPIYCPWLGALPKPNNYADEDSLYSATFFGKCRQEINRAASLYCHERFQVWK